MGKVDESWVAAFGLAAKPVDTARALLDGARIPCEIMVNTWRQNR